MAEGRVERAIRAAAEAARAVEGGRKALIRALVRARRAGATVRQLADATGLSVGGVHKLTQGEREEES